MKQKEEQINEEVVEEVKEESSNTEEQIEFTKDEVEAISKKTYELEKKLEEAINESLRAKAELINYRKRKDEETSRIMKYANEGIILELLTIIDNFERALSVKIENVSDEVNKYQQGINMIYQSLVNVLKSNDVSEIEALNKKFDANYHQAVASEENEDNKDIVLEVYQKGYMLKDKLLRPAMVKVGK